MRKRSIYLVFVVIISGLVLYAFYYNPARTNGWSGMERILERISEPQFREADYDITGFGATEKSENNAEAIHKAIEACSSAGGGRVVIPAGEFRTGAVHLKSNVNLHLSKGARLVFSTDPADYLPLVITRWEGIDCYNYSPLIYANNCDNIAITGNGILDGQADSSNWWTWKGRREYGWNAGMNSQLNPGGRPLLQQYEREKVPVEKRIMGPGSFLRPQFINFYKCKNILVEDITVMNAPFWLIHPVFSENITLRNVKADSHGPNNDGFDPESSRDILVEKCSFNTGDDCIAIKSGRNNDGRRANIPGENIIVRNCTMKNGHGGVVIGSEISGGARNIYVENCRMDSPELERAIRIKTNTNRGGLVENIFVRNITIGQVKEAVLKINCEYEIDDEGTGPYIPLIKNIYLDDITSRKSEYPVYLQGIKDETCIDSIIIRNSDFKGVLKKSYLEYTGYVDFDNVDIEMAEKK